MNGYRYQEESGFNNGAMHYTHKACDKGMKGCKGVEPVSLTAACQMLPTGQCCSSRHEEMSQNRGSTRDDHDKICVQHTWRVDGLSLTDTSESGPSHLDDQLGKAQWLAHQWQESIIIRHAPRDSTCQQCEQHSMSGSMKTVAGQLNMNNTDMQV
jgi:hypothetical protein